MTKKEKIIKDFLKFAAKKHIYFRTIAHNVPMELELNGSITTLNNSNENELIERFLKQEQKDTPGPTGEFPNGQLNEDDDGELAITIVADKKDGVVILDFGKSTAWIGLAPDNVYALVEVMKEKAKEIEDNGSKRNI